MNLPPEGGAPDSWQTQEFAPIGAGHPHPAGQPAFAQQQQAPASGRGRGRLRRWGVGITAAAVLVFGGGAAAVAMSGGSGSSAAAAANLNATLSAASGTASGTAGVHAGGACKRVAAARKAGTHPTGKGLRACHRGLRELRLIRGIHGQVTFESKKGPRTLAFERGVIRSVSGSTVVVTAKDGTTWTWDLVSNTVVRHAGAKVSSGSLTGGEHVFVAGPVTGGANDARLIVVGGRGAASGSSPTSTPSASSTS